MSVTVVLTTIGLLLYWNSRESINPAALTVQNVVQVFTSDPDAVVTLTASVSNRTFEFTTEHNPRLVLKLDIKDQNPEQSVDWVVRVLGPTRMDQSFPSRHFTYTRESYFTSQSIEPQNDVLLIYGSSDELAFPLGADGGASSLLQAQQIGIIASLYIPPFDYSNRAGYAAKLPLVDYKGSGSFGPMYAILQDRTFKQPVLGILGPAAMGSGLEPMRLLDEYLNYPNADPIPYYEPTQLKTTMTLAYEAEELAESQLVSVAPPDVRVFDNNYQWEADRSPLSPSVTTLRIDYANRKATQLFFAGLLFGLAAATTVESIKHAKGRGDHSSRRGTSIMNARSDSRKTLRMRSRRGG